MVLIREGRLWLTVGVFAALNILWWGPNPLVRWLSTEALATRWAREALFVLEWLAMCTLMMLPTSLPLLARLKSMARPGQPAEVLIGACALGYLTVWALCGVGVRMLHGASYALMDIVASSGGLGEVAGNPGVTQLDTLIAATILTGGGIYLLHPAAERCARACRSPFGFIARHWHGTHAAGQASFRIGTAYGLSCLGCCWPLMTAMALLGLVDPLWMVGLTAVMALQKHPTLGTVAIKSSGIVLVAWGLAAGAGWLPAQWLMPVWSDGAWGICRSR